MKNLIWFVLLLVGCSESATELSAWQKAMRDGSVEAVAATKTVESKTDEAIGILRDNTTALAAIKAKVDALQVVSNPNGKDGDPESAPESPAKANDTPNPLKVATPGTSSRIASDGTALRWSIEGNWSPTILQTSAHLREHGIDTNGMTHQQMADLHASIHDGKPVAMKSKPVQMINRGLNCPSGVCPTNTRQRRGLFGGLFR
jgi:hypothetical protein